MQEREEQLAAREEQLAEANETIAGTDAELRASEKENERLRLAEGGQARALQEMGEKLAGKEQELAREVAGTERAAKRRRAEVEVSSELGGRVNSRLAEVKQEKVELSGDLEETQENLGYVVRAENVRMSQVDELASLALAAGADEAVVREIKSRKLY